MINEAEEKKKNRMALLISFGVHAILLVLFMLFGMDVMDPPPKEMGVEIAMADIGDTRNAAGNSNPTKVSEQTEQTKTQDAAPEPIQQAATEQVATDVNSDVAVPTSEKPVEKPKKKVEEPKEEKEPVKDEPRKVDTKTLYPGSKSEKSGNTEGGSQGNTEGQGDQGDPNGKPEGTASMGQGNFGAELNGRSYKGGVVIESTREQGIVVLKIWVDRKGNVIRTAPDLMLSNTTSQYLIDLATTAALKAKFSESPGAAIEQRGKMTFKFILQ